MKSIVVTSLALLFAACTASDVAVDGDRTITKVVKLLQDMLTDSKAAAEKDRDLFAKFKCYCDDNEVDKTDMIQEYLKEIKMLETEVSNLQASSGDLSLSCAQLSTDMADNEAAREEAQSVRDKSHDDFVAEEKDMTEAIDSMEQAIDLLANLGSDQAKESLLKLRTEQFMGKKSLLKLKTSVTKSVKAAAVHLTTKQKRVMDAFLQAPFTGSYTSQSGEIVGVLKNMRDTFKNNLANARSADKAATEAHEKFMKIKTEEFATMKDTYETKQGQLGGNDDELASNRESLDIAKNDLSNDQEFLAKLVEMCAGKGKEFETRKMLRANEDAAISQAIAVLNSDAAFESFGKVKSTKSGATSFIQVERYDQRTSIRRAVQSGLQQMARKLKSMKLANVVVLLEADNPFSKVLEEIEKMVSLIDAEQKADDDQKAWCETEREESHTKKDEKEIKIDELKNKITKLEDTIDNPETGLKATIKSTETDINVNHDGQVTETLERQNENTIYQKNIKNTVGAEKLLEKAIKILNLFYEEAGKKEELVQEDPKGPETWDEEDSGSQTKAGGDVIQMLEFILEETNKAEKMAHSDEEEAQHSYEDSMTELKKEFMELQENLAKLHESLADAVKSLGEMREELTVTEKDLVAVKRYLKQLKPGCDFIADNYDTRTENRGKEKTALEGAVKTLKGTPAFKAAMTAAEQEALGDCKGTCNEHGKEEARCQACLAGVSVPGYCVTHKDTAGC